MNGDWRLICPLCKWKGDDNTAMKPVCPECGGKNLRVDRDFVSDSKNTKICTKCGWICAPDFGPRKTCLNCDAALVSDSKAKAEVSLDTLEDCVNSESDKFGTEHAMKIRAYISELKALTRIMAEWHMGDGDECGIIARKALELIGDIEK